MSRASHDLREWPTDFLSGPTHGVLGRADDMSVFAYRVPDRWTHDVSATDELHAGGYGVSG